MKTTRQLKGVIPVVQTTVDEDGSFDADGQRRLIQFLDGQSVGGYWALGTGSEDMNLSFDRRVHAARVIAETNAGRKPLIMGAGFFALEDVLNFIETIKDLEFDAYHVMPYHPLLSLDRLDWFYRHIADHSPKPLWLYYSSNWSRKITPAFVAGLKDHPNITGIKFSSRDTIDQIKVLSMAEEGFQVITAVVGQFYAVLAMGAKASTTSIAGCLPEPIIEIYDLFTAGKYQESLQAQRRFLAFTEDLPKGLKTDNFLGGAEEKVILNLRGICEPYTSSYYRDASEEEKKQIIHALENHGMMSYMSGTEKAAKAAVSSG